MPPFFDVYAWVSPDDRAALLGRFIDRYVDRVDPGDPRFEAFIRSFVAKEPLPGDREALAELRRDEHAGPAFSLYLRATNFYQAIVTVTENGDVVLGLSLDDPLNDAVTERQASMVLAELVRDFGGSAGVGGVELAPPQSKAEWAQEGLVMLRLGNI